MHGQKSLRALELLKSPFRPEVFVPIDWQVGYIRPHNAVHANEAVRNTKSGKGVCHTGLCHSPYSRLIFGISPQRLSNSSALVTIPVHF